MKKGFTLVELLAVVVILALILAIAVPIIGNVINNAKISTIESDGKMLLTALRLKLLQDNSYNISGLDETNINTLNISNDNYESLKVGTFDGKPYIVVIGKNKWAGLEVSGTFDNLKVRDISKIATTGLQIWLEGSDITNNPNTTIWRDRSGNGQNVTLYNFSYNQTSGSNGNGGVVYDGVNDYGLHPQFTIPSMTNWTVDFTASIPSSGIGRWFDIFGRDGAHNIEFHSAAGLGWYINYEASTSYGTYGGLLVGAGVPIDTKITFAIKCEQIDATHANVSFYKDGTLYIKKSNVLLNPTYSGFTFKYVGSNNAGRFAPWTLYSYRLYNRALTDSEIFNNFKASL